MLIGLMRRLLGAHKAHVVAIVVLQLIQAAATLMLPTVNAAIIDDGIVAGNNAVITRLGTVVKPPHPPPDGLAAKHTAVLVDCLVHPVHPCFPLLHEPRKQQRRKCRLCEWWL